MAANTTDSTVTLDTRILHMNEFTQRAEYARVLAGLSLGQAAQLLGITAIKMGAIEDGIEHASEALALQMAKIYDVSNNWLLSGIANNISEYKSMLIKLKEPDRTKMKVLLEMIRK